MSSSGPARALWVAAVMAALAAALLPLLAQGYRDSELLQADGALLPRLPSHGLLPPQAVGLVYDRDMLSGQQLLLLLCLSGSEVCRGLFMKTSDGGSQRGYALGALAMGLIVSALTILFLHPPMELAVGWALYTAIEDTSTILLGIALWHEACPPTRIFGMALTFGGCVMLDLPTAWTPYWALVATADLAAACLLTFCGMLRLRVQARLGSEVRASVLEAKALQKRPPQPAPEPAALRANQGQDKGGEEPQESAAACTMREAVVKWSFLGLTVFLEVSGGIFMKQARGFEDCFYSVLGVACVQLCTLSGIVFLSKMDLSLGWSLYTGFEYTSMQLWSVLILGESLSSCQAMGITMTLCGVVINVLSE